MKKFICIMFALLVGAGTVLAGGGQNCDQHQGESGQGDTTTGEDAQGAAGQDRTGRADSVWPFEE